MYCLITYRVCCGNKKVHNNSAYFVNCDFAITHQLANDAIICIVMVVVHLLGIFVHILGSYLYTNTLHCNQSIH